MKKFVNKIQRVLVTPTEFFQGETKEKKLKTVAIFYFVLLIISTVLNLITFLISTLYVSQLPLNLGDFSKIFLSSVVGIAITMILSFVWSFLLHSYLRLFKAQGEYINTYQIFVYSSIPSMLLGWAPVVNAFASLYGLYLLYLGTTILHKLSKRSAAVAYLVLIIVFILYEILRLKTT
jgi:hypothetical protein